MATKTEAKIQELETNHATLAERVDNLKAMVETLQDLTSKVAVIEERLNELKRTVEEASRIRWTMLPPLVGAAVGAVLTLLVQLLLRLMR